MNTTATPQADFVNIRNILRAKIPYLYHLIPWFLISYVRKILHEKDLNAALFRNREVHGVDFVNAILQEFGVHIAVRGLENISPQGRYMVVANHPLGGLDGLALMSTLAEVRTDLAFPVNDFLLNLPNLRELFIPINKVGKNSYENSKALNAAFESDKLLLYFPAGLVSRRQKGQIRDLEWKKTFINKARTFRRDVIPVHIQGENSSFFYSLAAWRNRLKIGVNIEMLYLVDEMYRQKNKTIEITIGKPISYTNFTQDIKPGIWAEKIKDIVYALPS